MSIKIIEDEEITITRSEYESLKREWENSQLMTVSPCSLEDYIRGCKRYQKARGYAPKPVPWNPGNLSEI